MNSVPAGKLLLSLVALWAALGSYVFDWNATHIYNPHWPPHAKFHNAQDMLLGTGLGLLSLYLLWSREGTRIASLRLATLLAGLYWVTQAGALLFPGTALIDPEFSGPAQLPAQLLVDLVMLALLALGYPLAARRLKIAKHWQHLNH